MHEVKTIKDERDMPIMSNQNTVAFMLQVLREHESNATTEYDKREAVRLHEALKKALDSARAFRDSL